MDGNAHAGRTHSPLDVDEPAIEDNSAEPAPVGQRRGAVGRGDAASKRDGGKRTEEAAPAEDAGHERALQARAGAWGMTKREVIPLAEEELQRNRQAHGQSRHHPHPPLCGRELRSSNEYPCATRGSSSRGGGQLRDDATGDTFTEKTVEVTETSEVPVTEKVARLKEEVVVRREGAERTETVKDTVRSDQIAVEDASEAPPPRRRSDGKSR